MVVAQVARGICLLAGHLMTSRHGAPETVSAASIEPREGPARHDHLTTIGFDRVEEVAFVEGAITQKLSRSADCTKRHPMAGAEFEQLLLCLVDHEAHDVG